MTSARYIPGEHVQLVALALAALVFLVSVLRHERRRVIIARVLAIAYAGWVISVTLFPVLVDPGEWGIGFERSWLTSVNLVPLRTITLYLESDLGRVARINLLGNLALLVPFGALGPLLWKRLDSWRMVLGVGVATSVIIEVLQFGRRFVNLLPDMRSTDIDDIILNAIGALVGYGAFVLVRATWRAHRRSRSRRSAPQ